MSENNTQLKAEIDEFVDRVWPEVIEDIASLVSHPSVEELDKAEEGAPWGPGPRAALDEALCIAERMGLSAHDCEGYIGYADLAGASDKQIATIAHVDVVPEGPGWHTDPFTMEQREGWLLGRGVIDDKGPAVLSLHAARFFAEKVAETGEKLPYTLRILLGANEETSMGDVEYYLKNFPEPDFLFTPDAEFPVCCGEKGLYSATFRSAPLSGPVEGSVIAAIEGGSATNAVASLAVAVVRAEAASLPAAADMELEDVSEGGVALTRVTARGIGGHAAWPFGTRSAIAMLCNYLLENDLCSEAERRFLELEHKIHAATDGSNLGIAATDDLFDPLTCIGGTLRLTTTGQLEQTVDARFPKTITGAQIDERLGAIAAEYGCEFVTGRNDEPFYVSPDSAEIQTLVRCYNEYTGKDTKPFTIGGGTYARHFKNAASFGPEEPEMEVPEWGGSMHGPDECANEEQLRLSLKIYIYAIAELMKLEL
jgi:succinyl-diaminopimelate desuccinylase